MMKLLLLKKHSTLMVCIVFFSFVLTGCWDRNELNDLAFIKAIAIDKTKSNKVEISTEVLIPRGSGAGQGGGDGSSSSKGTIVRSAVGENLADAISKLQEKIPRKIFWGHAKACIFGESFAKKGIGKELDFLIRDYGVRERSYLFVSEGSAKKMIDVSPPIERNEAEVLRKLAESKVVMGVTILDFWKGLNGDGQCALMPLIRMLTPTKLEQQKKQEMSYIDKVAVFKKDKMVGKVDNETSRGVQWLTNNVNTPIITIHPKGSPGTISMKILHTQVKLQPQIKGGKLEMQVTGDTEDDVLQNATTMDVMDPSVVKRLEKELSADIEDRMQHALDQIQKDMKADVFRFGQSYHRRYPQEWDKLKSHWSELYPKIKVNIKIRAHILRPGTSTSSVISEEEVHKK